MTEKEVPEWMEYGICETCDSLLRFEEAYDHEVEIAMEVNWHGKTQSKNESMKTVKAWCSEKCKVADNL